MRRRKHHYLGEGVAEQDYLHTTEASTKLCSYFFDGSVVRSRWMGKFVLNSWFCQLSVCQLMSGQELVGLNMSESQLKPSP